jgi:hypothetical protein
MAHTLQHNFDTAQAYFEESLALSRQLAKIAVMERDYPSAQRLLTQASEAAREAAVASWIAEPLAGWALLAIAQRQAQRAARLLGAALATFERTGRVVPPLDRMEGERILAAIWEHLSERDLEARLAQGRAMSPEQAIDYALEPDKTE